MWWIRTLSGSPSFVAKCAEAHFIYVQTVDMCCGCPKSPFFNARVWSDSA